MKTQKDMIKSITKRIFIAVSCLSLIVLITPVRSYAAVTQIGSTITVSNSYSYSVPHEHTASCYTTEYFDVCNIGKELTRKDILTDSRVEYPSNPPKYSTSDAAQSWGYSQYPGTNWTVTEYYNQFSAWDKNGVYKDRTISVTYNGYRDKATNVNYTWDRYWDENQGKYIYEYYVTSIRVETQSIDQRYDYHTHLSESCYSSGYEYTCSGCGKKYFSTSSSDPGHGSGIYYQGGEYKAKNGKTAAEVYGPSGSNIHGPQDNWDGYGSEAAFNAKWDLVTAIWAAEAKCGDAIGWTDSYSKGDEIKTKATSSTSVQYLKCGNETHVHRDAKCDTHRESDKRLTCRKTTDTAYDYSDCCTIKLEKIR